jgi:hypothetical protein
MTRMNTAVRSNTTRQLDLGRLQSRITRQEARIAQGVKAGTLSEGEAAQAKSRLDSVRSKLQADAFDGDGLTNGKDYAKELRGAGKELRAKKRDDQVDPAKRMDNIDRRIEKGLENGSLTPEEADALKAKASAMRQKLDAASTPEQKAALGKELQQLSREVYREKHDGELDLGKRKTSFEARISAGESDGSLTREEAGSLREKLKGLGGDAQSVNELSRSIWRRRHDSQTQQAALQGGASFFG